jgi:hypothetical protein
VNLAFHSAGALRLFWCIHAHRACAVTANVSPGVGSEFRTIWHGLLGGDELARNNKKASSLGAGGKTIGRNLVLSVLGSGVIALPEAPHTSEGWHDASIVRRGVAQTINVLICIGLRGLGFQTHSTERRENSGLPKHSAA